MDYPDAIIVSVDDDCIDSFESKVFGAECFLENYPEIKTTGILCIRWLPEYVDQWYVINTETKRPYGDSAFFSREELASCRVTMLE